MADYDRNDIESDLDVTESSEGQVYAEVSRSQMRTIVLSVMQNAPAAMTVGQFRAMLKELDL